MEMKPVMRNSLVLTGWSRIWHRAALFSRAGWWSEVLLEQVQL